MLTNLRIFYMDLSTAKTNLSISVCISVFVVVGLAFLLACSSSSLHTHSLTAVMGEKREDNFVSTEHRVCHISSGSTVSSNILLKIQYYHCLCASPSPPTLVLFFCVFPFVFLPLPPSLSSPSPSSLFLSLCLFLNLLLSFSCSLFPSSPNWSREMVTHLRAWICFKVSACEKEVCPHIVHLPT